MREGGKRLKKNQQAENHENKTNKSIVTIILIVLAVAICVLAIGSIYHNTRKTYNKIVELSDLYGDIKPYGTAMLGDKEIISGVYEGLLEIDHNFSIQPAIAKVVDISPLSITVELNNKAFQLEDGSSVKCTADLVIDYYLNTLIPLQNSNSLDNPGLANLSGVNDSSPAIEKLEGDQIKFRFSVASSDNVLALTEKIGLVQSNGVMAGTKGRLTKLENNTWQVGKTLYIPLDMKSDLVGDERIVDMVTANILKTSSNLKRETIPNGAYGFLTWTENSQVNQSDRATFMRKLEENGIRAGMSEPADSIYSGTTLYQKAEYTEEPNTSQLDIDKPLRVGIIDMGSFQEVRLAVESTFDKLNIPVEIEVMTGSELLNATDLDMVYVRLNRGQSPDITKLLNADGLLGKVGYASIYEQKVKAIQSEIDWEKRNELLSNLDKELRENGVWLFLDAAFNIKVHK